MITVKRAGAEGMRGFQCEPEVKCADCNTGMRGMVWYAERLMAMHHTEPVIDLLCLPCARIAKQKLVPSKREREK